MCTNDKGKQINKQQGTAHAGVQMQGAVWLLCNLQSLLCNVSEYTEGLWRCLEKCGVGRIIVWDKACLQSLVSWVRAYHCDCIIFGISFYIWNLAETSGAGRVNTWIFKSVPNLIIVISLNPVNSGDSNGVIHISIPALGDENRKLLCFCLPALPQ